MDYQDFVNRLKKSQLAVQFVGAYYQDLGYQIMIPELVIAPHSVGAFSQYADQGDLFISRGNIKKSIEVKHSSKCFKNWNLSELIVNSYTGWNSKKIKPDIHFIVAKDFESAVIIDSDTSSQWELKRVYDSYKKKDLLFYFVKKELVQFLNFKKTKQMAKQIISMSINLDMITKSKLYEGKKGKYLNATLFLNDEVDQYGNNGFIVEATTKEEREAGVRGVILGNVKKATAKIEEPKIEESLPF